MLSLRLCLAAAALAAAPVAFAQTPQIACDFLVKGAADPGFGGPVTLVRSEDEVNGDTFLSVCTASTGAGESLTLLRREQPTHGQGIEAIVAAHRDQLAAVMSPPPEFEPLAVGDAALWDGSMNQLTVWSQGGKVMMIFTLFGPEAKARTTALAAAIVAAGG